MMRAMSPPTLPPLSVLDLSPIVEGGDAAQALSRSLDLARHAETWGYRRYWVAEHHNMDGVASSSTAVLVGAIAGATTTMRVGSGGLTLPNPAPLGVAALLFTLTAQIGWSVLLLLARYALLVIGASIPISIQPRFY